MKNKTRKNKKNYIKKNLNLKNINTKLVVILHRILTYHLLKKLIGVI